MFSVVTVPSSLRQLPPAARAVCDQLRMSVMPLPVCACRPKAVAPAARQQRLQFGDFGQRHAELGIGASGAHMVMVATAGAGIDAHQHAPAARTVPAIHAAHAGCRW